MARIVLALGAAAGAFIVSATACAPDAWALAITATAQSSTATPQVISNLLDEQNGDFLIHANPAPSGATGDGVDEQTTWSFNFSGDPNFSTFLAGGKVASAVLTLTLNTLFFVNNAAPVTDGARPDNGVYAIFPQWVMPPFLSGTLGTFTQGTVSADLIADVGMSGAALFDWLNGKYGAATGLWSVGTFPMQYADDAIVVSATLTLSDTPIPEPAGLATLGLALPAMTALRRRRNA